jgi:hypothetical protein
MAKLRKIVDAEELPAEEAVADEDSAYVAQGLIEDDDAILEFRDKQVLAQQQLGGDPEAFIRHTAHAQDSAYVTIYDREGRPHTLLRSVALLRLEKRYPQNHPLYPGQRMFFRRPPKQPPTPTHECPHPECLRKLYTEEQLRTHIRAFHTTLWEELQQEKESRRQRQLEEAILALASGTVRGVARELALPKTQDIPRPRGRKAEPPPEPLDLSEMANWEKPELLRFMGRKGIPVPPGLASMSNEALAAYVRSHLERADEGSE